ncbi:MAG: AAA family ATPase, partial [SAR324 cluster bacterium]|nr:AAA family ATPase [SAR324 cluster bacterium]
GFTAMSERLDPEEIKEIMGGIFEETARIVNNYGGVVEKYIGDAVMALFGVPQSHEDDALRAVHAARKIHQHVESLSPQLEQKTGGPLTVHSGINTGLVVTGQMNIEQGSMGVVGDTINTAARIDSLARPGQILVGANTHTLIERYYTCEELPPVTVKGKAEPVVTYLVLHPRERHAASRRFAGMRAELVGRKVELAMLQEAAERLRDDKGSIIAIRAEAGSGKSRLVEEFQASLPEGGMHWAEGNAHDYSQGIPYFPLIDFFSHSWLIEEGDNPVQVRQKLESNLSGLLGNDESVTPYIGGLFALDYPEAAQLSPELWKQRLHEATLRVFEAMAARGPTVFFFEDMHWADPSTLELLRNNLPRFSRPAVFLCAYRPPFRLFPELSADVVPGYREILLTGLSPSQSHDLTVSLLGGAEPPRELIDFVEDKAGGNPFYMEELLTSLIESNALQHDNGAWRLAAGLESYQVPLTVEGIIAARLDRLEQENKRLLQEAAVIGRSFLYEVLRRTTESGEEVNRRLEGLEALDMIRTQNVDPDLEYMFKHPLTQEVVYQSLLHRERQAIHERVGGVIEELLSERLPEFYERLAYHYKNGSSLHKAVDYLIKSGEKSLNRFALDEAHNYFRQASDLLNGMPHRSEAEDRQLFQLIDKWALVFYFDGNFRGLAELLSAHRAQADALTDRGLKAMYYAWLGFVLYFRGRLEESYHGLREALALGEEAGDQRAVAYACTWLTFTCADWGRVEEGIAYGERAVRVACEVFPEDQYLYCKSNFGLAYLYDRAGDSARTLAAGRKILAYSEQHANSRCEVLGHAAMGLGHYHSGDFPRAISAMERAAETGLDPFYSSFPFAFLTYFHVLAGQPQDGMAAGEKFELYADKTGNDYLGSIAIGFQGLAMILMGDMGKGMRLLQAMRRAAPDQDQKYLGCIFEYVVGKVFAQIAESSAPLNISIVLKNLGFLLMHVPFAARRAKAHLNKAIDMGRLYGYDGLHALACLDLGMLHKAKKKNDTARQLISEAAQLFEKNQATAQLGQAREALASLG